MDKTQAELNQAALEALTTLLDNAADINNFDALDELVHDIKDQEASDINNGGTRSQLDFLYKISGETIPGLMDVLNSINVKL